MSKESYKAELQRQAEDARQRRESAKAKEVLLERKQVEAAEVRHSLDR